MSDISAAEISEGREDFIAELLPDEATISRPVEEEDGGGGFRTKEYHPRETVPCRLDPYGGATSARGAGGEGASHPGERLDSRTSHFVTLPAETDIGLLDRIEINDTTFEINMIRLRGAWEFTRRVEVRESF
jgi:hypothetical protein